MFKIPRIERSEFYFEQALKAMQDKAQVEKQMIAKKYSKINKDPKITKEEYNLRKTKELEAVKIQTLNINISKALKRIVNAFPKQNNLDEIYVKLIDSSQTPFNKIEDAIDVLENIIFESDVLTTKTFTKLKDVKTKKTCGYIVNKHLGKISKKFKNEQKTFDNLAIAKQYINKLPKFENLYTVAIAGFPNVGKSTLMQKMSGSKVEVQNYPFTTKGLMFGYLIEKGNKHVQLIDTPGLLGREFDNEIEKRASIVINEYCEKIVFVLDVTESCGYSLEKQLDLLEKTKKTEKEIFIYLSKTDIYKKDHKEKSEELIKEIKLEFYDDPNKLREKLIKTSYKKEGFDIKSIKRI